MDKKPMLIVNEDFAEGVYAASGTPDDGITVVLTKATMNPYWANTFEFKATLPSGLGNQVLVTFGFDAELMDFYGSSFEASHSGRTATAKVRNAGTTFDFTAVSKSNSLNVVSHKAERF